MNLLRVAGLLLLVMGLGAYFVLLGRLVPLNPFRYRLSDHFRVLVGVAVPSALLEIGSLFLVLPSPRHPWFALPSAVISGVVVGGYYDGMLHVSQAFLRRLRPKRYMFLLAWYAWLLDGSGNAQKQTANFSERLRLGRLLRRYLKRWERVSADIPPAEFIRVHDAEIRTQLPRRLR